MTDLFLQALEQLPTFVGLILLAYILYRQNNRLLDQLFGKIDALERKVDSLQQTVSEIVTKLL